MAGAVGLLYRRGDSSLNWCHSRSGCWFILGNIQFLGGLTTAIATNMLAILAQVRGNPGAALILAADAFHFSFAAGLSHQRRATQYQDCGDSGELNCGKFHHDLLGQISGFPISFRDGETGAHDAQQIFACLSGKSEKSVRLSLHSYTKSPRTPVPRARFKHSSDLGAALGASALRIQ